MKDWQNISDNDLDDLFLKASKDQEIPPYTEKAWSDMSELLQKEGIVDKAGFWNSKKILSALSLLLLISFLAYRYAYIQNPSDNLVKKQIENSTKSAEKAEKTDVPNDVINQALSTLNEETENSTTEDSKNGDDANIEENPNKIAATKPFKKNLSSNLNENSRKYSTPGSKTSSGIAKVINSKTSIGNVKESKESSKNTSNTTNTSVNLSNSISSKNLALETSQNFVADKKELNKTAANTTANTEETKLFTQGKPTEITKSETTFIPVAARSVSLSRPAELTEVKKVSNFRDKLYLSLGYSPDISLVLNNPVEGMGSNFAAQVHYKFNDKWSIQTGVIKSFKRYSAGTSSMFWPDTWGAMPKEMEGMDASCNLYDIPLNVRFDFKRVPKTRFYMMTGVSSYLQIKENYNYVYPEGYDPSLMMNGWESNSKLSIAGTGNFAIGYERELFNNFSLQIEPFVKAPLRNFGVSELKLISTGVFISGKVRLR